MYENKRAIRSQECAFDEIKGAASGGSVSAVIGSFRKALVSLDSVRPGDARSTGTRSRA